MNENGTILHPEDIAKIPGINGTNTFFIDNTDLGEESEDTYDKSGDEPDTKTPMPNSLWIHNCMQINAALEAADTSNNGNHKN